MEITQTTKCPFCRQSSARKMCACGMSHGETRVPRQTPSGKVCDYCLMQVGLYLATKNEAPNF